MSTIVIDKNKKKIVDFFEEDDVEINGLAEGLAVVRSTCKSKKDAEQDDWGILSGGAKALSKKEQDASLHAQIAALTARVEALEAAGKEKK